MAAPARHTITDREASGRHASAGDSSPSRAAGADLKTIKLIDVLGGKKALHRKVASAQELAEVIRSGIPYRSVQSIKEKLQLSQNELASSLAMTPRTLARRKEGDVLRADEGDRIVRLAGVFARAVEVLGSEEQANQWLRHPNRALGGVVPLDHLDTQVGVNQVEEVLDRIDYGIYS